MASEEASTSATQPADDSAGTAAAATTTAPAAEKAPAAAASSSTGDAPAPTPKKKKKNYSTDPALYIYTSLTAGNMHIVTATSRLETILRANRVPFKATDLATDEKARMLWGRRAGKAADGRPRKLPGLVQLGTVLGVRLGHWSSLCNFEADAKLTQRTQHTNRTSSRSRSGTSTASSSSTSRYTTTSSPSPPRAPSPPSPSTSNPPTGPPTPPPPSTRHHPPSGN